MKKIWGFALLSFLTGCRPPQPSIPETVTDINGYVYRLISPEKSLGNGMVQVELWERIEPLETNHYYTPTLGSKINGGTPIFISLSR